ncbi:MAG TPA: hypothetical protein VGB55_04565 [Tepidisphaeraceae bacterium]
MTAIFPASIPHVVGDDTKVFAQVKDRFTQQPATVRTIRGDAEVVVTFDLLGPAASAERRSAFRACVRDRGVRVNINGENDFELADISPEGVGVLTKTTLELGANVTAAFEVAGTQITSDFVVHSMKQTAGRARFGLKLPVRSGEISRRLRSVMNHVQGALSLRDAA